MSTWWNWSGSAWHWTIYVLIAAVLAAGAGYVRFLREQRDRIEWDDGWQREPVTDQDATQLIAEWHNDYELPLGATLRDGQSWGRDLDHPGGRPQPGERFPVAPHAGRTLASATAGQAHLEPWLERAWWDDPDLTVWDARLQADRCWEILHVEFPRLRAELGCPA